MNTFDIIDSLLKERKRKQIELTNYLGVPKTHYTDWKTGRTRSYQKYLVQIAEFFGVSVDYLLGKTEEQEKPAQVNGSISIRSRDGSVVESELDDEKIELFKNMLKQIKDKNK